jgi:hypothetical protein
MAQTAFYSELNRFCLAWATPVPGSVTTYGGPLRTAATDFTMQLRTHQEALFEQLLLFDVVNLNITGPNFITPLMYNFMGPKALEELLEQKALSFVIWQPQPMMSHQDGKVAATFVGRIGDGQGSEVDIEKIIDIGLHLHPTNMGVSYKKVLRRKLIKCHSLLDPKLPESAWIIAGKALSAGSLQCFGLSSREESPVGLPVAEGEILLRAAESLLEYRYLLVNGMTSHNNAGVFDLIDVGLDNLRKRKSPVEKYYIVANFEKFPNLRALFSEVDKPFHRIARFRKSYTARRFREWLSSASDPGSDVELIREYVDACGNRKGLFESAPAKFVKLVSMIGISHLAGAEAAAIASGLLTSIPAQVIDEVLKTAAEFGTGVVESFVIDNLKVGWTPKAYFDGLRRLTRRSSR